MGARIVVWFDRRPLVAVTVALATLGVLAWTLAQVARPAPEQPRARPVAGAGVAPSLLPTPTQIPPASRVVEVGRALHAIPRTCDEPSALRSTQALEQPLRIIEQFARHYPRGGFSLDHESGSTLALLVVVRYELQDCDPSRLDVVEALLPPQFRDAT